MKVAVSLLTRLEFLSRVTEKECKHLLDTDHRLFGNFFTIEDAKKIDADPILAERLDAFVSRMGTFFRPVSANVRWTDIEGLLRNRLGPLTGEI